MGIFPKGTSFTHHAYLHQKGVLLGNVPSCAKKMMKKEL